MVDLNRGSAAGLLPTDVTREILSDTVEQSTVMQLARRVELPGRGLTIPVITGDAAASFVDETAEKPVSRSTLSTKNLSAHTLAVIEPFSNQFRRDLPGLYAELRRRLPFALAKAFDAAALHGIGAPSGTGWSDLSGVTQTVDVATAGSVYDELVDGITTVATAGGMVTGYAVAPAGQGYLMKATLADRGPIFVPDAATTSRVGSIFGAPVYGSRAVYDDQAAEAEVVGFAGDWTSAVWGTVEGIQIDISDQATLTDGGSAINLWQRNMFAVRCEIEVGFTHEDDDKFVKLTGGAGPVA